MTIEQVNMLDDVLTLELASSLLQLSSVHKVHVS